MAACLASRAQAGQWQFTVTGTLTASTTPTTTPPAWSPPPASNGGFSLNPYSVGTFIEVPAGSSASGQATFTLPLTVTATWLPSASNDTAPPLRVTESSVTSWNNTNEGSGTYNTSGSTADDGFGDSAVYDANTNSYKSTSNVPPRQCSSPSWNRTLSATAAVSLTVPAGGGEGGEVYGASLVSYSVSAIPITAALKVDQDQQVSLPASTTRFSATVSNAPPGSVIDWVKISVDGGTPISAAMTPGNSNNYYINWPSSSAGNPSEHTVKATAQIHDSLGSIPLDSTTYLGNGRLADDVIADIKLQSLQFNNGVTLAQDRLTQVPKPEMTWNTTTNGLLTANPCSYLRNRHPALAMTLSDSAGNPLTGSATKGYTLKWLAAPHTTDPSTSQPDPMLTLFDNSSGSPTACGSSVSVNATTLLYNWIARYTETFPALNFYVKFNNVTPTPTWGLVGSYGTANPGNTLYALLSNPTGLMSPPWVGVLDDACVWA